MGELRRGNQNEAPAPLPLSIRPTLPTNGCLCDQHPFCDAAVPCDLRLLWFIMSLGAGVNPGALGSLVGYQGLVSDFQYADRYDAVGENDRMDVDRLDYDGLEWLEEGEESRRKARAENLLTEVHSGLSALGTTIKIITALLTVLGADSTRRYICCKILCNAIHGDLFTGTPLKG